MTDGPITSSQQATIEQQAAQLAGQRAEMEAQRRTISELTTRVLQIWEGVLALPIVGSVDTGRAQDMTEKLLERVVATGSEIVLRHARSEPHRHRGVGADPQRRPLRDGEPRGGVDSAR